MKNIDSFKQRMMKESKKSKILSLFGRKVEINTRGNIVVDGVEFFSDISSGAVKKGTPPNSSSRHAQYSPSNFEGQLQGRVYTGLYSIFKKSILNGMSEGDIVMELTGYFSKEDTNNPIGEFMDYLGLEDLDYDNM